MTYVIRVRPLKGVDGAKALRWALKYLLRSCKLKCISIEEIADDDQES